MALFLMTVVMFVARIFIPLEIGYNGVGNKPIPSSVQGSPPNIEKHIVHELRSDVSSQGK